MNEETRLNRNGVRAIVRDMTGSLLHLVLLLASAGTFGWTRAWICTGLYLFVQGINALVLVRKNPDLLNRRGGEVHQDTKRFDRTFVAVYSLLALVVPVVAGLDVVRYGWSGLPVWLALLGTAGFLSAFALGNRAMVANTHFETTVFVRPDGEQRVCDAGPYRFIRHPGYLAAISSLCCVPLILGSAWAFAPLTAIVILFIWRTAREDQTLLEELPGYSKYAQRTSYRLLPLVW